MAVPPAQAQHGPEQHPTGGCPHVTCVPSTAPHGCFAPLLGMWDPSPWGNSPPELPNTAVPSEMASFCPSCLPSVLPFSSFPLLLSFPSLFPSPGPVSSCCRWVWRCPIPHPPWPCCWTRFFAPHHPPALCAGSPMCPPAASQLLPPQHTPAAMSTPSPAPAMLCTARGAMQPPRTYMQCTVHLGMQCNALPPKKCPA